MNRFASRLSDTLANTALSDPLPPTALAFCEERAGDAAVDALSEPALRGLSRVVASQAEVASFLSHRSHFLERVAELGPQALVARAESFPDDAQSVLKLDLESALDSLRLRRREEMAFAACADLAGLCSFEAVSLFLSRLAESTLQISLALARRELRTSEGDAFAVIGMGKLAGRELTYHSDLDLIFLFQGGLDHIDQASRTGQRLISYLTTMTGAGVAYPVDTRLRPSGRQGMLVTSFEAFERYQRDEAQTWEHLAQLRGRAVAGSSAAAEVLDRVHAHILTRHTRTWKELAALRERVRLERAAESEGSIPVKTGAGGLMDVDFLAGGGLLERGAARLPEFPSVPAMLRACASGPKIEALIQDYDFLRVVEARARWVAGRGIEAVSAEASPVVAELVEPGLAPQQLVQRLGAARERVRGLYDAVVKADSLAALDA